MSRSARTAAALAAVVLLGAAGVSWWLRSDDGAPPAEPPPAAEDGTERPQAPPLQAPVSGPPPAAPAAATEPVARFPNGTTAPLLNGVQVPVKMRWPADLPWSPIARKVVDDNGMEWYLHEDGSWSTTVMLHDKVHDQQVPAGLVFDQKPVRPLVTDEGKPRLTPGGLIK